MPNTHNNLAAFIWSVADLLRGDFKQSQYGRIILPFTLLRRLECVLEPTKDAVVAQHEKVKAMKLPEDGMEKMLLRASKLSFFNTSPMNLSKMGQGDIKDNLENYVQSFSRDAREIFEHFKFDEFVGTLNEASLLYKVVQKFTNIDLSPKAISNHDMGLVFEELIRRFAESSNETAGEHFTPRDIVELTTSLVFMEDDDALNKEGIIRTIYDPTAGTGGFLSSGMEYVYEHNKDAVMRAFGQELNPESYAICKADMLIKGQDVSRIKLDAKERKQFLDAVTWKNPEAEPVIKKILKGGSSSSMTPPHTVHPEHKEEQPLYGAFAYQGKIVEFQTDGDLRDNENIPLNPSISTSELIETYFNREVTPHVPDAWINADKCDAQDGEIGIVGYEIPFNRHFYVYQPPLALEAIDADLDAVSTRIMSLLQEVHS